MVLWFYAQKLPKAQPAVVLVLKRLRRRGNSLKSHLTDWERPGIEPATPGLQDIGLSPTPRQLQTDRKTDRRTLERNFLNGGYNINTPHFLKWWGIKTQTANKVFKNIKLSFCIDLVDYQIIILRVSSNTS